MNSEEGQVAPVELIDLALYDFEAGGCPVTDEEKNLPIGATVKVYATDIRESFWVRVQQRVESGYVCRIDNDLFGVPDSASKSLLVKPSNIREIWEWS